MAKTDTIPTRICSKCSEEFEVGEPTLTIEVRCPSCQAEWRKDQANWNDYVAKLQSQD